MDAAAHREWRSSNGTLSRDVSRALTALTSALNEARADERRLEALAPCGVPMRLLSTHVTINRSIAPRGGHSRGCFRLARDGAQARERDGVLCPGAFAATCVGKQESQNSTCACTCTTRSSPRSRSRPLTKSGRRAHTHTRMYIHSHAGRREPHKGRGTREHCTTIFTNL